MREFLKDILKLLLELFEQFPIITGILSLFITIYCIKYSLPKAYREDKTSLYVYYNKLGLIIVATLFSSIIFFIQLFRIL
tara:strand:- start:272 stop:511 length:240 start_codon:yes stop_codon:yes gene_type:complete